MLTDIPSRTYCRLLLKFWTKNRPLCPFEPLWRSLTVSHKETCSRLSSVKSEVQFYTKALGSIYDVHLWVIGKLVVDFLLVLTELFFDRCYGWCATSENRLKIGVFSKEQGRLGSKFQVEEVIPYQTLVVSEN